MSEETIALNAVAAAATLLTVEAANVKDTGNALNIAYQATKDTVENNLNNVENTSDADKEVSTAQAAAISQKVSISNLATVNGQTLNTGAALVIERSATSLVHLSYEDRANMTVFVVDPILDDSVVVEGIGLLMFVTTQNEPEDDETCFNVITGGQFLLNTPAFDLLEAYDLIESAIIFDHMEDVDAHLIEHVHHPH